jgi:hypothetical protein
MNSLQTLCKHSPGDLQLLCGQTSIHDIARKHFLGSSKTKKVIVMIVDSRVIYSPGNITVDGETVTLYIKLLDILNANGYENWTFTIAGAFYIAYDEDMGLKSGAEALSFVLENLKNLNAIKLEYTDKELGQ